MFWESNSSLRSMPWTRRFTNVLSRVILDNRRGAAPRLLGAVTAPDTLVRLPGRQGRIPQELEEARLGSRAAGEGVRPTPRHAEDCQLLRGTCDARFSSTGAGLARQVDFAANETAVLDHDAPRVDVADELRAIADVDLVGTFNVSL
jgi:hypothetical protein